VADRPPPLRFSSRKARSPKLELAFRVVQRFVSRAKPSLAWTRLVLNCREIVRFRTYNPGKQGQRALMHTFHEKNAICSLSMAGHLPDGFVIGLLLHEFGHLGSRGGEREADRWILDNFGIRIQYVGELDLEWVDDWAIRRILREATPLRQNPRQARQASRPRRPLLRPR
jgi:hypothetical protein